MNEITLQELLAMGLKPPVGWLYLHMAAQANNNMLDATHEDMAAWVGVTRQTARNYLLKLESKSLIQDVGGGRYVVRGLVHPPHTGSTLPDVKKLNIQPDVHVKHFLSDTDSEKPNVKHAEGSDVKKVNIFTESESKTLPISDSDSESQSQTPATDVKHEPVPTRTVTSEAVALWGEMPKSWHELIDGYVAEFGAAWVLAAIKHGQSKSDGQRPRHPRWLRAVVTNGIQEGKTPETLGKQPPPPSPLSLKAREDNPQSLAPTPAGQGSKSLATTDECPPMPEGWMPQIWRETGAQRTLQQIQMAWQTHYRYGLVSVGGAK